MDAVDAGVIRSFTPQRIVGLAGGTIQAEAEKIDLLRANLGEDIVKQKSVGINGNGSKTPGARIFNGGGQIRMQGRFTTQKNKIGGWAAIGKYIQPGFDGF